MDSKHLTQNDFFNQLGELFTHKKETSRGAIYLTQKRLILPTAQDTVDKDKVLSGQHSRAPTPVIIRASNGKSKRNRSSKVKVSTIVEPHDLDSFYTRFADICKSGMVALKPRDRSKKKAKAKKKKTTTT